MKRLAKRIAAHYRAACTKTACGIDRHSTAVMMAVGVVLLTGGLVGLSHAQGGGPTGSFSEAAYDDSLVRGAVGNLFKLIEGAFGALIMVVAGLGAIVAAAMGAYRAAVGMLVVAVGAFILRALVSLFFGDNYQEYSAT
jgi:hypothetical protein